MSTTSTASGGDLATPLTAGVIAAVVGFTSSFAVVLAGLSAVGASPVQATSGLVTLSATMGLGCVVFSVVTKMPITMAWSTPGAALIAAAVAPRGGFGEAVGAFLVTGVLLFITGLVPALATAVRRIPHSIANAMLAGILLTLCVVPFQYLSDQPALIGTMLGTWALLQLLRPRWAVPGSLVVLVALTVIRGDFAGAEISLAPELVWTGPDFSWASVVAISIPLYLVTMTSQNIPGVAIMSTLGYDVPLRRCLGYTGIATAVGAPLGGHAINLAAISAALAAGPDAGADQSRRWVAGVSAGLTYLVLGAFGGAVVAMVEAAPAGIFAAFAGLALLATLANATQQALVEERSRLAAIVTIVVAASGLEIAGVGAAFWALVAGMVLVGAQRLRDGSRSTAG